MGRWIDRAALAALTAVLFYLLFVSAYGNIAAACCMSFLCCSLLFRFRQSRGEKFRMTKHQAQTVLENWAYGSDKDAESQIASLIAQRPGKLVYLPKHPTATLSMGDVFSAWKSNREAEKLIVAAVCHSDGRARTFSATLQSPSIEIMDAARLIPMIRRSNLDPPQVLRGRQVILRIKSLLTELPMRRPWYRNLLFGLGLMLVYLVTGIAAYLILSISALFLAGVSLRVRT